MKFRRISYLLITFCLLLGIVCGEVHKVSSFSKLIESEENEGETKEERRETYDEEFKLIVHSKKQKEPNPSKKELVKHGVLQNILTGYGILLFHIKLYLKLGVLTFYE